MKSGNLNFLEPSGPLQACNGTAFNVVITDTRNVNFGNSSPLRFYRRFGRTRSSIFSVKQWITWPWRKQLFTQRQGVMCQKTWPRFMYVLYAHKHLTISFLHGEAPYSLQHLLFCPLTTAVTSNANSNTRCCLSLAIITTNIRVEIFLGDWGGREKCRICSRNLRTSPPLPLFWPLKNRGA